MSFAWDPLQLFNQLARHWEHEDLEEGRELQLSGIWVVTLPLFSIHSAFQVDIIIDIRPSRKDPELVKNLILILKCKKSVNWVIKSFDVKGNLKVLVSWLSVSLFWGLAVFWAVWVIVTFVTFLSRVFHFVKNRLLLDFSWPGQGVWWLKTWPFRSTQTRMSVQTLPFTDRDLERIP